jgi:hypothetical protein
MVRGTRRHEIRLIRAQLTSLVDISEWRDEGIGRSRHLRPVIAMRQELGVTRRPVHQSGAATSSHVS